jgi:hypothetical protein
MQQDQVGAAAVEAVGRQVHLLRRRQVDEARSPGGVGSDFTMALSVRPFPGSAQVK